MPSKELEAKLMDVRAVWLGITAKTTTKNDFDMLVPLDLAAQATRHLYGRGDRSELVAALGVDVAEGVIRGDGVAVIMRHIYKAMMEALHSEGTAITCLSGPMQPPGSGQEWDAFAGKWVEKGAKGPAISPNPTGA